MSAVIPPVAPVSTTTAVQPVAGSDFVAADNQTIAITDPASSTTPVAITAPTAGSISVASATESANVVIGGTGTAQVNIGIAQDGAGGLQNSSGTAFQVDENYQGRVIANLDGAAITGANVDTSIDTGNGTIADNAPPSVSDGSLAIDYYVNGGAADDEIQGSRGNDFIRAGAGDDKVNAGAGNDIVRTGTGDDEVTLGAGDDIVYFTVDQLQGTQTKVITDFDSQGDDKIQIDSSLQGLVSITGQGTSRITISLSGAQTGTTTVESGGETIDDDDIEFV